MIPKVDLQPRKRLRFLHTQKVSLKEDKNLNDIFKNAYFNLYTFKNSYLGAREMAQ